MGEGAVLDRPAPLLTGVHHVSLMVQDTQVALAFYCGILGLSVIARPALGYPGAWLQVGTQQLHLLELPNPDPTQDRPTAVGRDRHTAFSISVLDALETRLQQAAIPYQRSRSGRAALFCRDPDGNGLEFVAS